MSIINFYKLNDTEKVEHRNPNYNLIGMKHPFYAGIVSASGGGKTNLIMNLIYLSCKGKGTWSHIYVVHKMDEPLYDLLKKKLGDANIDFYKNVDDLPTIETLRSDKKQQLLIFDDQIGNKKGEAKITEWFIRGRKANFSILTLSQSYYPIPKTIRLQFHYLIVLKIRSKKDVDMILRETGRIEVAKKLAMEIFEDATKETLDFLKIDLNIQEINKVYSHNFNDYYNV